jgi:hypothetical protein
MLVCPSRLTVNSPSRAVKRSTTVGWRCSPKPRAPTRAVPQRHGVGDGPGGHLEGLVDPCGFGRHWTDCVGHLRFETSRGAWAKRRHQLPQKWQDRHGSGWVVQGAWVVILAVWRSSGFHCFGSSRTERPTPLHLPEQPQITTLAYLSSSRSISNSPKFRLSGCPQNSPIRSTRSRSGRRRT